MRARARARAPAHAGEALAEGDGLLEEELEREHMGLPLQRPPREGVALIHLGLVDLALVGHNVVGQLHRGLVEPQTEENVGRRPVRLEVAAVSDCAHVWVRV